MHIIIRLFFLIPLVLSLLWSPPTTIPKLSKGDGQALLSCRNSRALLTWLGLP